MLQALAKVFSRKNKQELKPLKPVLSTQKNTAVEDDIPRYPPFAKGIPSASVDRVVRTQDSLISRIKRTLRFNSEEFDQYVLPVISRYAAHVHLLPASESHHHRGAGGLFRHGLEVGFWAAQEAESKQFTIKGTPEEKRNNEPKWQYAAFLGGLLHDVGKPLSDLAVADESGDKIWNPYSHSLIDWANSEKIDRYFLRWRDNRHKRHETFSLLNIDRILTPETRSYLSSTGPEILEAMLESIAGTSAEQDLTKIVMWADQQSTSRDLKQQRLDVDEYAYGVPVERYVFDAMRRLIKAGQWKVNEPGGKVWLFREGAFVVWKFAAKDIAVLIQDDKIPGVPRDADTLADILIERGYALTFQDKDGEPGNRFWPLRPTVLDEKGGATLYGLRLDSLDLLFTDEPPSPTKGYVGHAALAMKAKAADSRQGVSQNIQAEQTPQTEAEVVDLHQSHSLVFEAESPPLDSYADFQPQMGDQHHPEPAFSEPPSPESPEDRENHPAFAPNPLASLGAVADGIAVNNQFSSSRKSIPSQKKPKASTPNKKEAQAANPKSSASQPSLSDHGFASGSTELPGDKGAQYIRDALSFIEKGTHDLGQAIYRLGKGRYSILYPDGAKLLGKQTEVMKSIDADNLLEPDPVSLKKVQEKDGVKMLVLNQAASTWIECQLRAIEQGNSLSSSSHSPSQIKPVSVASSNTPEKKPKPQNKTASPEAKKTAPALRKKGLAKKKSKTKAVNLDKPLAEAPTFAADKNEATKESPAASPQNKFSIEMQIEKVVKELKSQIKAGKGRWVTGAIEESRSGTVVGLSVLDRILEEYPAITKRKLRAKFVLNNREWGLSGNKLTLKEQG